MSARPLYELAAGFNAIFDLVLDETMDLEQLEGALQSIECEVEEKCANGIALIKSLETYAAAYKAEKKRFEAQQQSLENRIKRIKEWYRQNLDAMGKSKVPTKYGVMSVQNNGGKAPLKIDDASRIPDAYLTTFRSIRKSTTRLSMRHSRTARLSPAHIWSRGDGAFASSRRKEIHHHAQH